MKWMIAGLALVLAGCATSPTVWYKDGGSQAALDEDLRFCNYEAMKYAGATSASIGQSYGVAMHRANLARAGIAQKGYSTEPPPPKPYHHVPLLTGPLKN